jgi:hypothetical protein
MSDREIRGYITDVNGKQIRPLYAGDKIQSGASLENYKNKKMREIAAEKSGDKQEWNLEHFFKGHIPEIRELMKSLTVNQKAFLFSIATYVGYEDCCIKYDNGKCFDFDDLVIVSGLSRGTVSKVVNELRDADIIYKGYNSKGIQYFMNPWIYCKGIRINAVLKTMFKNYHVRVLGGKQWGRVGEIETGEPNLLQKAMDIVKQ